MPLYDYRCHRCGKTFEVRQKFSDPLLKTHEGCGGEVERLISAPALQFKGTGWYVTDYGKGGNSPSKPSDGKSDNKSEKSSETKSETKTDSKPAATAPAKDK
jgi:putative FmdB family regulatory protein